MPAAKHKNVAAVSHPQYKHRWVQQFVRSALYSLTSFFAHQQPQSSEDDICRFNESSADMIR